MDKHPHKLLAAYHDRQLNPQRVARVEQHLAGCPVCRAELADLQSLQRQLLAVPAPQPAHTPQVFAAALLEALPPEPRPAPPRRRWAWALAPAGLVLLWALLQALSAAAWLGMETPTALLRALDPYLELLSWRSPLELFASWLLANYAGPPGGTAWLGEALRAGYQGLWLAGLLVAALWVWAAAWYLYRQARPQIAHRPVRRR